MSEQGVGREMRKFALGYTIVRVAVPLGQESAIPVPVELAFILGTELDLYSTGSNGGDCDIPLCSFSPFRTTP